MQVFSFVLKAGGSDVTDVAEKEILVAEGNGPDSDIKFPAPVKEGSFQIFLNDPVSVMD